MSENKLAPTERYARLLCESHPQWTGAQCQQVMAAVRPFGQTGAQILASDLPEDHPLRTTGVARLVEYPMHRHVTSYPPTGVIMDEAIEPAPERKPIVARQAEIDAAERRIWSDAGVSEYAPIDPAAWANLRPLGKSMDSMVAVSSNASNEHERPVVTRSAGDLFQWDEATIGYWRRKEKGRAEKFAAQFFESVQVQKEVPPLLPAKPVLLVPEGCTLTVPPGFDLTPYDVLVRGKLSFPDPAPAPAAKPTPAGLTFEQPIQNRLGRMAK